MDKQTVEAFKAHQTRRALRNARREASKMNVVPRAPQLRPLTPIELDRLANRRIAREEARQLEMRLVFGKKKKLPLPVFSCKNEPGQQLRPRVMSAWRCAVCKMPSPNGPGSAIPCANPTCEAFVVERDLP